MQQRCTANAKALRYLRMTLKGLWLSHGFSYILRAGLSAAAAMQARHEGLQRFRPAWRSASVLRIHVLFAHVLRRRQLCKLDSSLSRRLDVNVGELWP